MGGAFVDCGAWQEELGLYLMIASRSGERKSEALRAAERPLRTIEAERAQAALPALGKLKARRAALESRLRKLAKRLDVDAADERAQAESEYAQAQTELDELPEPHAPRIFAADVTPEALGGLLARHGSIVFLAAESAALDNLLGRYSDGSPNLHIVCSAYSGEPTTIDRKGHEPEKLPRPTLAMAFAIQPHVLERVVTHQVARDQGFTARFAYALPTSRVGQREADTQPVSPEIYQCWIDTIRRVASLKSADSADNREVTEIDAFRRTAPASTSVGIVSTFEPKRITLDPGAKRLLTELQRQVEPRLGDDGDLSSIADWANRNHGRAARIAGLLHLCEHGPDEPIGEQTMRASAEIGGYLLAHAIVVFSTPDPDTRKAMQWLERRGETTVTQRDLHRGPLAGRGTSKDTQQLVERLERLGILRALPGEHPTSRRYEVHPDLTLKPAR